MIERGLAHSRPRARGPFSLGRLARLILCAFHPQNKPSSHRSPTFGPTLYKFIVMGSVRKPWPYSKVFIKISSSFSIFLLKKFKLYTDIYNNKCNYATMQLSWIINMCTFIFFSFSFLNVHYRGSSDGPVINW